MLGSGSNPAGCLALADAARPTTTDVTEIYSPARITKEAPKHRLQPGLAMDLLTGWNFNMPEDRHAAWTLVSRFHQPQA